MKEVEVPTTITVDDGNDSERIIKVNDLSNEAQRLIEIYTHWRNELNRNELDRIKLNTAIKAIENEILSAVHKEFPIPTKEQDTENLHAAT